MCIVCDVCIVCNACIALIAYNARVAHIAHNTYMAHMSYKSYSAHVTYIACTARVACNSYNARAAENAYIAYNACIELVDTIPARLQDCKIATGVFRVILRGGNSRKTARPQDCYNSFRNNLAGIATPARLQDRKISREV